MCALDRSDGASAATTTAPAVIHPRVLRVPRRTTTRPKRNEGLHPFHRRATAGEGCSPPPGLTELQGASCIAGEHLRPECGQQHQLWCKKGEGCTENKFYSLPCFRALNQNQGAIDHVLTAKITFPARRSDPEIGKSRAEERDPPASRSRYAKSCSRPPRRGRNSSCPSTVVDCARVLEARGNRCRTDRGGTGVGGIGQKRSLAASWIGRTPEIDGCAGYLPSRVRSHSPHGIDLEHR